MGFFYSNQRGPFDALPHAARVTRIRCICVGWPAMSKRQRVRRYGKHHSRRLGVTVDLPFGEPRPRTFLTPRVLTQVLDRTAIVAQRHRTIPERQAVPAPWSSAARTYEGSFRAEMLAQISPDDQASLDALPQPAPE
jgi:hypothetical protein